MRIARAFLALLLVSLPACSSDGSPAPAPIVVGVLAPVEGGLVEFGRGIADSVRLAVAEQAAFLARRARAIGYARAAVVSETKAVSKGLADDFVAAFTAIGGVVTVRTLVPDDAKDFSSFLADAIPTDPDLVFFGGEYPVASTLRRQASAAGLDAPVMGGDGIKDPAYFESAGRLAVGTLASTVGVPVEEMPGGPDFVASYAAAGFDSAPSAYGPYAYDAAIAAMRAIRAALDAGAGSSAGLRAGVVDALGATDFAGVTGRVRFDESGDPVDPVFTLYRVEGDPLAWVEWR